MVEIKQTLRAKNLIRSTSKNTEEIYVEGYREGRKTIEAQFRGLQLANKKLVEQLNEAQRVGGTIHLERSWKKKYLYALKRANKRLEELGQEPERIRNRHDDSDDEGEHVEQLTIFDM